jgi:hypothetical protein
LPAIFRGDISVLTKTGHFYFNLTHKDIALIQSGYEITLYRHELMDQVVSLLHRYHLGGDRDINLSYFKWRYYDNPYSESPLGVVTFHENKVVGFRGYLATKWHIPDKNYPLIVLIPGDTCVHPDHRRKGLSVSMGNMAMNNFASEYQVFLNTSASKNSVPGYLRMGFVPIADKTFLLKYNLFVLLIKRYLWTSKKTAELSKERIRFGEFDDIIVTANARPKEMSAVAAVWKCAGNSVTLFQDEQFFRWRFNNKRNRYVFYYSKKNNVITGYVVMLLVHDSQDGYIVDFAEIHRGALKSILRYIIKKNHFNIIAVPNVSLDANSYQMFEEFGFKANSLIERKERKVKGIDPFLIRPVKRQCVESNWYIEGLDIRKIENWKITGLCNDGY